MTMSKVFRLRRLLGLRRRQEEQARAQLAQSLRRVSELSDEVRARSDALEAVMRGREPKRHAAVEAITDASSLAVAAVRAAEASAMSTTDE
ncbi:MAG: hypothetical protein ACE5GB_15305, partial [Acidimicrobiales bacterium]